MLVTLCSVFQMKAVAHATLEQQFPGMYQMSSQICWDGTCILKEMGRFKRRVLVHTFFVLRGTGLSNILSLDPSEFSV